MEAYAYKPLSSGQIRLLKINSVEPDIKITIEEVNLGTKPSYITISYCWEGQKPIKEIVANGLRLLVTENVHEILCTLFALNHGNYFWIDAVCIDQENISEKSIQIPMMTEIYSRCTKGVAWLGPSDSSITQAALAIPEILSRMNYYSAMPALLVRGLVASLILYGFGELLSRPWFGRIWVVQEFVLPCEVELLCGLDFVDPKLLHLLLENGFFLNMLVDHELQMYGNVSRDLTAATVITGARGYVKMCQLRAAKIELGISWPGFTLMEVLGLSTELSALDAHDRIYGVLGILEQYWRDNLIPNYRIVVGKLYASVSELQLRKEGHLSFLTFVHPTETLEGLPSWCINLQTRNPDSLVFDRGKTWPYSSLDPGYSAGGLKNRVEACTGPSVVKSLHGAGISHLDVSGFLLDYVAEIVPPGPLLDQDKGSSFSWISDCLRVSQRYGLVPDDIELIHKRTMTAGRYYDSQSLNPVSELYKLYHSYIRHENESSKFLEKTARQYLRQMPSRGRTYFSTQSGTVGLGSSLVRPGDHICIFHNEPTPYIIRSLGADSNRYSFVGEAYVDGVMHGETLELEQARNCQIFALV
jgi:hypothetical protein